MLEASEQAATNFHSPDRHRGHFKAWALLRMPEITRAFRFAYPTLLATASNNAFVWDVPRSQLISVIRDLQRPHHKQLLGNINYVEVNDLYVFVCGGRGLRIFGREDGALLYQLSTMELCSATWDVLPQSGLAASVVHPQMLLHNIHSTGSVHGEFMACTCFCFRAAMLEITDCLFSGHVSTSGNDLSVLTKHGKLVILPDFQQLFAGSNAVHHRDTATILNFQPFSSDADFACYLAVGDRNGKLAIATVSV